MSAVPDLLKKQVWQVVRSPKASHPQFDENSGMFRVRSRPTAPVSGLSGYTLPTGAR